MPAFLFLIAGDSQHTALYVEDTTELAATEKVTTTLNEGDGEYIAGVERILPGQWASVSAA